MKTSKLAQLITAIAGTVISLNLVMIDKAEAIVYGVKSRAVGPPVDFVPPTNLYSFQENGTGFINYGALTLGGSQILVDALAISDLSELFGFHLTSSGSTLISITPGISNVTPIGSLLSGREMSGAVFQNNQLWAIDNTNNELLQIDSNTGSIIGTPQQLTLSGSPFNLTINSDIAVDKNNQFYLTQVSNLYSLDLQNAELTLINNYGSSNALHLGMTFSDNANDDTFFLAEHQNSDDIFRSNNINFSRNAVFTNIIGGFNAGGGDLAAIVTPNEAKSIPEPSNILGLFLVAGVAIFTGIKFKKKEDPQTEENT